MKTLFYTLLVVAGLLFSACSDDGYWNEGAETTTTIALSDFQTIVIQSMLDVELVPDTVNRAVVTCGKNLIGKVSMLAENNVLTISQRSETNWTRSYKHTFIELHYKSLTSVQIHNSVKLWSAAPVACNALRIDDYGELSELDVDVQCTSFSLAVYAENCGIYKVKGTTANSTLYLKGSAHFITDGLIADSVYVQHYGIGDCFVNATRVLAGKIALHGLLRYKHQPGLVLKVENISGTLEEF